MTDKTTNTSDFPALEMESRLLEQGESAAFSRPNRFGLSDMQSRQMHSRFELTFVLPAVFTRENACEVWLSILENDLPALSSVPLDCDGHQLAGRWLQCVLHLTRLLLQALRVPVFDAPQVLWCMPVDDAHGRWKAAVMMAGPQFISRAVCEDVLKFAFGLAKWTCNANPGNSMDRVKFFQAIKQRVLQPYLRLASPGKSTYEVLKAAYSNDIPFQPLAAGIYQLGWGSRSKRFDRSTTDRDTAIGRLWTQNKFWTARVLAKAGLPTPVHQLVDSLAQALVAAEKIGYPLVVKPVDLERGEGVFVDVSSKQMEWAYTSAHDLSPSKQVLVEQQVPGVCHRLFVCAGRLLYAVKRLPMGIYGDGRHSVNELVNIEIERQDWLPPWKQSGIKPLDDLALSMLRRQGWRGDSVPPAAKFVALRRIETSALGGVDEEVTTSLHPENLKIALAAANIFGLEVAGVDIISADITQPWYANGAVINEVNFAPLLGGGEISRRYLDEYLNRLVADKGRIEVVVFVGGTAAWNAAQAYWQAKRIAGVAVFMTNAFKTLDADGNILHLVQQGLCARLQALILRREVQALVVVVQSLELLNKAPVLDRVDSFHVVDDNIARESGQPSIASASEMATLVEFCRKWSGQL